ncbi:MAG: hypothetical protein LBQ66_05020 [Planctomycetaceae bacterium]|nr:hypothetical protein [Planctomycetaceae bacterium]
MGNRPPGGYVGVLADNWSVKTHRLPTLRLPTRFGVPFQLVRFYYAQRRAGRLAIPHIFFWY